MEPVNKFDDYSREKVPERSRYGLYNMFFTLSGVFGAIAVIFAGGVLGTGETFNQAVIAVVAGVVIMSLIGSLTSAIGSYSGLSTYEGWRFPFGRWGGKISGFVLITITTGIGWFAVESWFFGVVINEIFPNNPFFSVGAAAIWGGALMILSTYIGYRAVSSLSYFIIPQHIWLILLGLGFIFALHGGFGSVFTIVPAGHLSLTAAITDVVGLYIAGTLIAPDITRFARKPRDAVIAWNLHMWIFYPFLVLGAVAIVLMTGSAIITADMLTLGMGVGVIIIIVLGQWIINTINLYSGSLSFSNFVPISREKSSLIVGVVGVAMAGYWGFSSGSSLAPFESFISILGEILPAVGGVVFAEFFIIKPYIHKIKDPVERFHFENGKTYDQLNVAGIAALAIGSATGIFVSIGIAAINSLVVAFSAYLMITAVLEKMKINYRLGKYEVKEVLN